MRSIAVVAVAVALCASRPARAEIDGDRYTSTTHGVRLELPRGWRVSESSGYPRVLLTLSRSVPRARILVTIDRIVPGCRTEPEAVFCTSDPASAIAQLRGRLESLGVRVTAQQQSRTPEVEYELNRRYVRHALVLLDDDVVSVVIATETPAARSALRRTFDQLVQNIRRLSP